MRHLLPLLAVLLLVGCGDDPAPTPTPEASTPAPTAAPEPAYPADEALDGLLPAEPEEAVQEAERAAKQAAAKAAAKERPTPAPAPAVDPKTLPAMSVVTAVLASDVKDRRPVGEAVTFREGTEVYCFNVLENPGGTRRGVRHEWFHGDVRKSSIKLSVKGTRWRTWSSRPLYGPGAWRVDVVDDTGAVLRSLPFEVTP